MVLVKVCSIEEVPKNGMKGFSVNGREVFVARAGDDYYCNDSACTHRGAPLHDGDLREKTVTCPWHGAQFDVTTGRHLSPPAPGPLKNHRIEVRGKEIWADIE